MITGEVEAVDRKQKIRDRYKGVDISELEVIPAKIIEDLETSSVIRRVAASNSGEIKCMALVRMIYGDSGWDKKMSYRLLGRAFPQQRLVSFKITDAMQIENGRLTEM